MMDFFDNFMGAMNFYERWFGFANRIVKPSKGGRFGPTVKVKVLRLDKGGKLPFRTIVDHLRQYGVATFDHGYDAKHHHFRVRKTQIKFATWLYNDGALRTPKKAWGDGKAKSKRK